MKKTDIVIIGAGIAGISAAIYLKRANAKFVLLEGNLAGGMLNQLKSVENYPAMVNTTGADILIALIPKEHAFGAVHSGDYFIEKGLPRRKQKEEPTAPYLFTGIQILHPRIFDGMEKGVFSLVKLYDKAEAEGRLKAVLYDGDWYHVGTPEALQQTEEILKK